MQDTATGDGYALKLDTKKKSSLPLEDDIVREIHQKSPGGRCPQIPKTKLVYLKDGTCAL